MKKIFILLAGSVLLACSPKANKATASTAPVAESPAPAPAPSNAANAPTDAQLAAVKTKFPAATMDELKKGHVIYYGACTNCHGAKPIGRWTEQEWVPILDNMAAKANLSAADKDATWKYISGVLLAK
jgi:hypothetical protein